MAQQEKVYKCLNPVGISIPVETSPLAPRLDTLDGKTICLTSNQGFKSHVTFPVITALLRQKYPNVKIVLPEDMPRAVKPPAEGAKDPATEAMTAALRQRGCQAVISGNGG